ncbi:LapA family protein [Argonema antarcticum]|uniref:LapA family protein n=1 Tax=Argonema antarcticum TaxID=2942763 RepID=UPI0023DF05A9|nr:LapA family protein [Argonema antarcticum]
MIRAVNFLIIFVSCLALVLFSLENTEPAVIKVIKGVDLQAPLCIELIVAMGLGAILAGMFSVWFRMLRLLESRKQIRQIREKDSRIQKLEKDLEQYKVEISENDPQLPAGSESAPQKAQAIQALAKS